MTEYSGEDVEGQTTCNVNDRMYFELTCIAYSLVLCVCMKRSFAGRVRALTALHQEKTKALMKSIDSLKSQVRSLQASQKEHRRSGLIRALQRQVREQELAADVLKQYITDSTSISRRQVRENLFVRS